MPEKGKAKDARVTFFRKLAEKEGGNRNDHPKKAAGEMKILTLFILAIFQFAAQSVCFLDVLGEKGPRWNLHVFLSTLSIVLIIIFFTIWIMHRLNENMMTM